MMVHGVNMEKLKYEKINKNYIYNNNIFFNYYIVIVGRTMIGNHFAKKNLVKDLLQE
jgi:hypothetical protein